MSASRRLAMTGAHVRTMTTQPSSHPQMATGPHGEPLVTPALQGSKYLLLFKAYATVPGLHKIVLYFHDIPMGLDVHNATLNYVVEIPRWSNAKFEINTAVKGNPITQDVKNGAVRFVHNIFPHHGYMHNYGAVPQTWEDPGAETAGLFGDGDPLDVCEIGSRVASLGEVRRGKILGLLALVDDGELDWKVIVIDVSDPLAKDMNDIRDVATHMPGLLEQTRDWFRDYKLPAGKPPNRFAFGGQYRTAGETVKVVQECHAAWERLVAGRLALNKAPLIENATLDHTPGHTYFLREGLLVNSPKPDTPVPESVHKSWFYDH